MDFQIYFYKAKNLQGKAISGQFKTNDVKELNKTLRQNGYYLVNLKRKNKVSFWTNFNKVDEREISLFWSQFSELLKSGINISECLNILYEKTTNKSLKNTLGFMKENVQKGDEISNTLAMFPKVYSNFAIKMIKIGEETGNLDDILTNLSEYYEKMYKYKLKLKKSMSYPILTFFLTFIMFIFIILKIIPVFSETLEAVGGSPSIFITRIMVVNKFLLNNFHWLSLLLCSTIALSYSAIKNGNIRQSIGSMLNKIHLIRRYRIKLFSLSFSRDMSILLNSGISVINSLEILNTLNLSNSYGIVLKNCLKEIQEGNSLHSSLAKTNMVDTMVIAMISVGEETGKLDLLIKKAASILNDEIDDLIEKICIFIQPAMILFLSAIIGIVIASVMIPMINVMDAINM